jgi:hypothetical protein
MFGMLWIDMYDKVFQFQPISSNFSQPLKRSGTTFHRPQSTARSTLCEGYVSHCRRQMVVLGSNYQSKKLYGHYESLNQVYSSQKINTAALDKYIFTQALIFNYSLLLYICTNIVLYCSAGR